MKKINKEQLMKVYNIRTGGIRHTEKTGEEQVEDLRFVSKILNDMYYYIFLQEGEVNKVDVNKAMDILSEHIAFDV